MDAITDLDTLHALYGVPKPPSMRKVADQITPEYRAWIEAAPFAALTTVGPEGTDCSPRGDAGQVAFIEDAKTLALPDRRGNDRIDSLRNIVRDPRVSLMLMVPGSDTVIRVNGAGRVSAAPELLERYTREAKAPRTVILVTIEEIYFQCARAVMRAALWSGAPAPDLPTPGDILAAMTEGEVGGAAYDKEWPERARNSMW